MLIGMYARTPLRSVSVLFNEPKLLKSGRSGALSGLSAVSVLFNEPKLLKFHAVGLKTRRPGRFSALQRAEIAEIDEQRRG